MEKIGTVTVGNYTTKKYVSPTEVSAISIMDDMLDNGVDIAEVIVDEETELDMKRYSGTYPVQIFRDLYPIIKSNGVNASYTIKAIKDGRSVSVDVYENSQLVTTFSKDANVELPDLISNSREM